MRMVVIGGGAAGMSAASKARRQNPEAEILVIESGSYISYAECGIPYLIQGIVPEPEDLLHYKLSEFTEKRNISVRTDTSVARILPENNSVRLHDGSEINYDSLVLATGAKPRGNSFIDGRRIISIRSLESGINARNLVESGKRFVVVGDGILGLEIASSLIEMGKKVTIVSRHDKLFPKMDGDLRNLVDSTFRNVASVVYGQEVTDIKRSEGDIVVVTSDGREEADGVIFATGIEPNSKLAHDAGLRLNKNGTVVVDHTMRSSEPNIFAAGDVAQTFNLVNGKADWHALAQVSNKMGRVAGCNAAGGSMNFPGSINTSLVRLLGFEVGFTGLSMADLKRESMDFKNTFIRARSRANYYPGAEDVLVSINYSSRDGRILGAQVISRDGGAWRLNTLAMAIYAGLTVEQLFYSDLGYSPPFGPVWDPLIIAASVSMRD